jgi:8-oxo-dGTP diphosphatase
MSTLQSPDREISMRGSHNQAPEPTPADLERPLSSVEVVVIALVDTELKALLVRRPSAAGAQADGWALPGRQINVSSDADLLSCARSTVNESAGVSGPYLEQLGSWGSAKRDPRGWAATHVYIALLPPRRATRLRDDDHPSLRWHAIQGAGIGPSLALDHREILAAAAHRLRSKSEYTSLPAFLLPVEFTLSDLQRAYEVVLGWSLEKKAFRTRILATDLVEPLDRHREAAHRPAMLYRLKDRKSIVHFPRPLQGRPSP